MKKLRVAVGLFLVATLPACGKASAKARASASTEQSARSAPPKADPPLAVGEDVAAMFGHEARYRPPGTVRVETALEAFRRAGIDVSGVRQHLARPFGAKYCSGAAVAEDISISLCEYASRDEAIAGRALSLKAFASVPNRDIAVEQATTLTVRQTRKTAASERVARALFAEFHRLTK